VTVGFRERHRIPDIGVGVGLRSAHEEHVLAERPPMDWFEVIAENYMTPAPKIVAELDTLTAHYRVLPHGVSMNIGSASPLDPDYLARLKSLLRRVNPPWYSDHLCFTGAFGLDVHDLLPLPYTKELVNHVVERVKRVIGTLEVPFALENVSSYLTFRESTMPEWEFLSEVAERADSGILLDCNNVFVSAHNHGFDAGAYIDAVPADRVVQIHLAGHSDMGTYLLDTHAGTVRDEVMDLYRRALRRIGRTSTLIEWDTELGTWAELAAEAERARRIRAEVTGGEGEWRAS
jgi:uncharacterized protein (UPF0276 family)